MAQPALQSCEFEPDQREAARLEALAHYDILDTPPEPAFDRIARLIQNIFDTPIAIVSMIDGHRQWYKAGLGLTNNEVPVSESFCRYLLLDSSPLMIPDALQDTRVSASPMVTGAPYVRFYAGTPLITGDGHIIGTVCAIDTKPRTFSAREMEILADLGGMAMDTLELRRQAAIDFLTNLLSRRALMEAGRSILALAQRESEPLSAIAIDIDHFKSVNDTHGHAAGDAVLKAVAETCRRALREADLFGRVGGEEFVALLPRADVAAAQAKAERFRSAIGDLTIQVGQSRVNVTASLGVAGMDAGARDLESLMERADAALYRAKSAGRNQTKIWRGDVGVQASAPQQSAQAAAPRRRVLKAGRLNFGDYTVDCTVRMLGEDGAGIDVSSTRDMPDRFEMIIASDGLSRACKVATRDERHLDVMFV